MIISPATPETRFNRADLLRVAQTLPSAPRIFAQVSSLLLDHNSSLDEITQLLKRDAALSARILRVSNSVAYAGIEPIASLDEAVQRVGFGETYRHVGFATAAQVAPQQLPFYGVSAAQFRENALLTALIVERLAGAAGYDARSAYTAGLLRSIGKVALDRVCAARRGVNCFAEEGSGPLLEWESQGCGMDNAHAAEVILSEWRFPEDTVAAVRHHYQPREGEALALLLNIAAGAAERCGHGWPGEWSYWLTGEERLAEVALDEDQMRAATRDALQAFGPVRVAVG